VATATTNIQYVLSGSNIQSLKGCLAPANAFLGLSHPALNCANFPAEFHYLPPIQISVVSLVV